MPPPDPVAPARDLNRGASLIAATVTEAGLRSTSGILGSSWTTEAGAAMIDSLYDVLAVLLP